MIQLLDEKKYTCNLCGRPVVCYITEQSSERAYYHEWSWQASSCLIEFDEVNTGVPYVFVGIPVGEAVQQIEKAQPIRHLVVYKNDI